MKEILFLVFIKRKNRIHSVQRDEVPEIRVILLIMGAVSWAKQFRMKFYYLQCKQFQFIDRPNVLFGQVR